MEIIPVKGVTVAEMRCTIFAVFQYLITLFALKVNGKGYELATSTTYANLSILTVEETCILLCSNIYCLPSVERQLLTAF